MISQGNVELARWPKGGKLRKKIYLSKIVFKYTCISSIFYIFTKSFEYKLLL